jgi:hypothetical protein
MLGAGRHHLAAAVMIALSAASTARLEAQEVTLYARCAGAVGAGRRRRIPTERGK